MTIRTSTETVADELIEPVHLALALESEPGPGTAWLIAYLGTLDISVAWLDRPAERLVSTGKIPALLEGIFEEQ